MIGNDFPEVLAAARSGAEWAVSALWRDLHPPLLRFLRGLDRNEAEDVESETWLGVARGLQGFEGGEEDFRAWIFMIARHRLIDSRRRAARRPTVSTLVDEITDDMATDDPAGEVEEAMNAEAALAVVRTLPVDQAEVILLRVVAGLDVARVAAIVGKRRGTVRVLQHRGLRRLARYLEQSRVEPREEDVTQ